MDMQEMEYRIIKMLQRMERVTALQECAAKNCEKQVERIDRVEDRQKEFDRRLSEVQETTANLHELMTGFQATYKKLQRLAIGMAILILLSIVLLSVVGFEALPYIVKLAGTIF